jgi:hypothetical protein
VIQPSFNSIIIGSTTHTGQILINGSSSDITAFTAPVQLLNSRIDGGVITINGSITNSSTWMSAYSTFGNYGMAIASSTGLNLNGNITSPYGIYINAPIFTGVMNTSLLASDAASGNITIGSVTNQGGNGASFTANAAAALKVLGNSKITSNTGKFNINLDPSSLDLSGGNIVINANGGDIYFQADAMNFGSAINGLSISSVGGQVMFGTTTPSVTMGINNISNTI